MSSPFSLLRPPPPHGLAFAVEDLCTVRDWAEARGLTLTVALDHVMDGAEFEEVLVLASADRRRRVLTLWRTRTGVYARTPNGPPRCFAHVGLALAAELVSRPPRFRRLA